MAGYANPDVLVETQWLADHLGDPDIRLIEANYNTEQYASKHIPGSLPWTWSRAVS